MTKVQKNSGNCKSCVYLNEFKALKAQLLWINQQLEEISKLDHSLDYEFQKKIYPPEEFFKILNLIIKYKNNGWDSIPHLNALIAIQSDQLEELKSAKVTSVCNTNTGLKSQSRNTNLKVIK